jgi:glycosyltransferase involved in cell wall biosynthesis
MGGSIFATRGRPAVAPTFRPAAISGTGGVAEQRVRVAGKKFLVGGCPFRVRGVTYGSFLPRADGHPFPATTVVRDDFAAMRSLGLTTVRTYAVPPPDVLDAAEESGLRLLMGLHYDDWRAGARTSWRTVADAGRRAVDEALEACTGRPGAVLGVVVGNEVPADLVRVEGIQRTSDLLSTLVAYVHEGDRDLLAAYANYPSTEYLDVEGADFLAFNVFLERLGDLQRYAAHLHVLAGNRPVVLSEVGLAAGIHGADRQAQFLAEQLAEVDASGAAGACVFSWTDEWGVAGEPVDGWGFGLTTEDRRPRPAVAAVRDWAHRDLRDLRLDWPTVSVVVCAYNEERYLPECLDSLLAVDYPRLEVIVCDDGSTDATPRIADQYPFRVLHLSHGGLSAARNAGLAAARGDIVAYLDADARCDADWPYHLALSMEDGAAATGGPNLPVPEAAFQERVVGASPGGPVEVLVADDRAEHVAGCNMAFRREVLTGLGGFDAAYTSAGDDVDVCWRLLDAGHEIAFAHAAQVWHHRRDTIGRYLRQQRNYGRSERMVSGRHAGRFNRLGQATWAGFLYCSPRLRWPWLRPLLYHGYFGTAPYQRVLAHRPDVAMQMGAALLPLTAPLALCGLAASAWTPWALTLPALAGLVIAGFALVAASAVRPHHAEPHPLGFRILAGAMHAVQPFVRTWGRLRGRPLASRDRPPTEWDGDRISWLLDLEHELARGGRTVRPGRPSDHWDLTVTSGPLVTCRVTTAVLWGWEPRWQVLLRPRRSAVVALATVGVLPLAATWLVAVPGGLAVLGALEGIRLWRAVSRALAVTTTGAGDSGSPAGRG